LEPVSPWRAESRAARSGAAEWRRRSRERPLVRAGLRVDRDRPRQPPRESASLHVGSPLVALSVSTQSILRLARTRRAKAPEDGQSSLRRVCPAVSTAPSALRLRWSGPHDFCTARMSLLALSWGAAAKRRQRPHPGQPSLSFVVHGWRKRVLEEEPNHLAGGIGTPRKSVGTGRAASRPSVTGPMNGPLFYHRLAAGVDMQHAAVRKPTRYLASFDQPPERRALARLRND